MLRHRLVELENKKSAMALALIRFLSFQDGYARFRIDTGTNPLYNIKIGQGSYKEDVFDRIDGVVAETGFRRNDKSETLFDTDLLVTIPAKRFTRENCFVQLETFKDESRRAPAYSKVLKLYVPLNYDQIDENALSFSYSQNFNTMYQESLNPHRNIPFADGRSSSDSYSKYPDLLRLLTERAGPMVEGMLGGCHRGNRRTSPQILSAVGMLNTIINAFMNGLNQQSAPAYSALAKSATVTSSRMHRFSNARAFGSDSIGADTPIKLPDLQNDDLTKSILEQLQKEALLRLFLENQPATGGGIDLNQLLQLLQQTQAPQLPVKPTAIIPAPQQSPVAANKVPTPVNDKAAVAGAVNTGAVNNTPVSVQKSINAGSFSYILSNHAMLTFESAAAVTVNEKELLLYKKQDIKLKLRINVVTETPEKILSKAIIKFSFKGPSGLLLFEKIFKKKDIGINESQIFEFSLLEIQSFPNCVPISVSAEISWPDAAGTIVKAFGNTSMSFTEGYIPKTGGKLLPSELELSSMDLYRPFWNKIWESPEAINENEDKYPGSKKLWSVDVNLKYCILLSGQKESNGLMETKLSLLEQEQTSITHKTEGKIKSGIELSISELNKLSTHWGKPSLSNEKLAALRASEFLTKKSYEGIHHLSMKGKMREKGMYWVVPILNQQEIVLSQVKTVDDYGQVTEVQDELVLVPIPTSIRILGLKTV